MMGKGDDEGVKALTVCEIWSDSFAVWIHPDGNSKPVSGDCRCDNPVPGSGIRTICPDQCVEHGSQYYPLRLHV